MRSSGTNGAGTDTTGRAPLLPPLIMTPGGFIRPVPLALAVPLELPLLPPRIAELFLIIRLREREMPVRVLLVPLPVALLVPPPAVPALLLF